MTFKPPCESQALADYIITFLNELVDADPVAMTQLIETRVPCDETLVEHPTVQVLVEGDKHSVGMLGILNGIIGARPEDGWGYVAAEFDDDGRLVKFLRTPPHAGG